MSDIDDSSRIDDQAWRGDLAARVRAQRDALARMAQALDDADDALLAELRAFRTRLQTDGAAGPTALIARLYVAAMRGAASAREMARPSAGAIYVASCHGATTAYVLMADDAARCLRDLGAEIPVVPTSGDSTPPGWRPPAATEARAALREDDLPAPFVQSVRAALARYGSAWDHTRDDGWDAQRDGNHAVVTAPDGRQCRLALPEIAWRQVQAAVADPGAVFDALVRAERARQDAQWGQDDAMSIRDWVSILAEESGEAAKAMCEVAEGKGPVAAAENELVQTAAMCRWIYKSRVLNRCPPPRARLATEIATVRDQRDGLRAALETIAADARAADAHRIARGGVPW